MKITLEYTSIRKLAAGLANAAIFGGSKEKDLGNNHVLAVEQYLSDHGTVESTDPDDEGCVNALCRKCNKFESVSRSGLAYNYTCKECLAEEKDPTVHSIPLEGLKRPGPTAHVDPEDDPPPICADCEFHYVDTEWYDYKRVCKHPLHRTRVTGLPMKCDRLNGEGQCTRFKKATT